MGRGDANYKKMLLLDFGLNHVLSNYAPYIMVPLRLAFLLMLLLPLMASGQKPALTQDDIAAWKTIASPTISNDGHWVAYQLKPNEGDPALIIHDIRNKKDLVFPRSKSHALSADSRFAAFLIQAPEDTVKAMRRRKVKKDDLPQDTLVILNLASGQLEKIPSVKGFTLPPKWAGWLAYHLHPAKPDTNQPDSIKVKKESEANGSRLVIRNLAEGSEDTIAFVKDFIAAEEGAHFLLHSTGTLDTADLLPGIYRYDGGQARLRPLLTGKGDYAKLALGRRGRQAAFLAYRDTIQAQAKPFSLFYWNDTLAQAQLIADTTAAFLPEGWFISEHASLSFSKNGQRLFFGIAPPPLLRDTTLLDEEAVQVEVWAYTDGRLYTQLQARLEQERKRAYTAAYHPRSGTIAALGGLDLPQVILGKDGDAPAALGYDETPYQRQASWEGSPVCKDLYWIDVETGQRELIAPNVCANPGLSPDGRYAYWYSSPDSAWFAFSMERKALKRLAPGLAAVFYDELNDQPRHPSPYGIAGWTTEDDFILIYDRYDIWKIDPAARLAPNRLTNGRAAGIRYRYIKLDPEERGIEEVMPMLFHTFNERTKASGYAWYDLHTSIVKKVQEGPYSFSRNVQKAKAANAYLFTRESFREFPDLLYSNRDLSTFSRISQANPQQADFRWGQAELYRWTGAQGQEMEGLLIKPDGFDPARQYPMITYFYERNADNLHRHWSPTYPRSIINFPYYASRGYLIFVPDIHYRVGYPGESALEAVTTGVTSLIGQGFVDREHLGLQGHSWGGYQIAYIVTRTKLFRCAEAGAPVSNMTSAYGGIRWESGLSRMFQYERSQSRIGGTLWEKPLQYIENSPLFFADKIETPLLILHNDDDGAVPWYQGIEFFVALRRLGKPAWLLNYNGEKHGLQKTHNKKDFQRRMQQFFDHYLLGAPLPQWMETGISPLEKGILQGFEPRE
jgi:dipeptidyl aminopeptidase/acylaminoacyl peptidase